ncbi:MAG: TetR/AcrR family transcriptional regulator [Psychromonas sp.]|nr:TetR/AcrR family transcriptional regulator [Psychromonas sp.]
MREQKKRGRPKNKDRQLNQDIIIYMAKTLMREQGVIPSIRGLARALDVDAMAIYHYFENKNSLLEAISISLMDSIYFPKQQLHWQGPLQKLAESYLNLLRHYSGLLDTLILMPDNGPMMIFADRFNKVMAPLELDADKQKQAFTLLLSFLHGQALLLKTETDEQKEHFDAVFKLYCSLLE